LGKQSLLEAIFFPEAFGSGPYLLIADWNIQAPRRELSKLAVLQARIGTAITGKVGPSSQGRKNYGSNHSRPENKGLGPART
jgi:hypothetical protein